MAEQDDLLASIAEKTADYRAGELAAPTPEHVDRWISQFDVDVRLPMLREVNYVLERTYFSKQEIEKKFADYIRVTDDQGKDCNDKETKDFWRATKILNIQKMGRSQADINEIIAEALRERFGLDLADCQGGDGRFVYFDDILFSGGHIQTDLKAWLKDEAPKEGCVWIYLLVAHELGKYETERNLKEAIAESGKDISFDIKTQITLENRKKYCDRADVFWPTKLPDDEYDYNAVNKRFPFVPRPPLATPTCNFSHRKPRASYWKKNSS